MTFELDPKPERLTIREACKKRMPLGGPDAQALEGALQATERERDKLRDELVLHQDGADNDRHKMEDFLMEEFGDERGKTWDAPFTTGKFIEMIRDRLRHYKDALGGAHQPELERLNKELGDLAAGNLAAQHRAAEENTRLRAEIARMQIAFDQELARREDRRASRD